jgi:DNA primase
MAPATTAWVDFKEIKGRVSIIQILERYGVLDSLTKAGSGDRLSGTCPIHGGTNKTHFRVSVSKNCWNCFGKCQSGGNIIDFVSKKEDIPFRDAALLVAEWFPGSSREKEEPREKPRFDTGKLAVAENPRTPAAVSEDDLFQPKDDGEPNKPLAFALTKLDPEHPYLMERGLSPETIATFGLGYCGKGLQRGHVVIPIHNSDGHLVAYAGRWPGEPEDGKGKYKFPEGFKKSIELFNYHRAIAADHEKPLVVVEGFFDAMKLHQAGYERVVAIMGSSLSDAQEELLTRYCATPDERLILFFDGNEAGQKGQADALARLAKRLFVRAVELEGRAEEPEDLTAEELRALLPLPEGVR